MTIPPVPVPVWLAPDSVRAWLKLDAATDPELVAACAAAVEPQVERARPDQWVTVVTADDEVATYTPDAEVYQAAVMLAARLYRRRNSAGGIELFAESVTYVSKYDPEIERALRVGSWRRVKIG